MNEALSLLGKQLAEQRQLKGLTIAQLSNATKISPSFIEAMENGNFDFLPEVYVKAFLRAIAKEIGLDPEVIGKQFSVLKKPLEKEGKATTDEAVLPIAKPIAARVERQEMTVAEKSTSFPEKALPLWLNPYLLGGLAIVLSILLLLLPSKQKSNIKNEIETGIAIVKEYSQSSPAMSSFVPISAIALPDTNKEKKLTVQLRATETAWVRIVYNDSLTEEGLFSAGDSRTFISQGKVYLKIGNAGGIHITVEGQDLGVAGKKGRVANLLIDHNGIQAIAEAEFPPQMNRTQ